MTNFIKTASAAAIALTLAACASTYDDSASDEAMMEENAMMAEKAEMTEDKMMAEEKAMMKEEKMMDAPMVGGAAMYPSKTIVENASAADNLTTLVSLVKQAELVETLSGPGPFTVFAPTDSAFEMVPADTVEALTDPANKDMLTKVLTAHVISGKVTSADLAAALEGNASYSATTVSGDTLTFYNMDGGIRVADENGTLAMIENADVMQSNGVVHVVNSVLVPQ
ncbi:fasciclin domain-containing protein [Litorimonas haliclonae]|uniref:fasciclin domain-containing protein n=1 Tax=Litorimonas haliclonae TaxID=2081977 RepID=UPI0039F091A2